jgi:hypothetical protein
VHASGTSEDAGRLRTRLTIRAICVQLRVDEGREADCGCCQGHAHALERRSARAQKQKAAECMRAHRAWQESSASRN